MSSKRGPWRVIDVKNVYKNSWIEVKEDKVIRPDGNKGIFGVVKVKSGVSVLPIDDNKNIYLIEQFRYVLGKKNIEAVSGGIENKEKPLDAAKRELKEETGIEAKEWVDLGKINPLTIIDSTNYLFIAKNLTFLNASPEGTENIKLLKIPLEKAINWVMEGLITNSLTALLILKIKELKNS
ncbi:MAG: NUDIX hydrolase [Candidatus Shapirobacteria bacterium]|nr:NUDIX hydrolase [Candidatus Shapirobacteria bacterium]MDD4410737.1 NUDIX hydrolase [Candidatus Shapirobacteria bacterium]